MPDPEDVTIRPPETPDDYRAVQDAQRRAWGGLDESSVVPIATLVGAHRHGGLVLGAFLEDGSAVGVSFAFLGRVDGRLALYSQLTGIVPGRQGSGLGTRIKLAQRDYALKQGLELIAWAFDPLQAGNARFNVRRLGATVREFVADMYGPRSDPLNRGTPTDRVIALWETSPKPRPVADPARHRRLPKLVEASPSPDASPRFHPERLRDVDAVAVEIPPEIGRLRREAPEVAAGWLTAIRSGLIAAFESDFRIRDFLDPADTNRPVPAYLLVRETQSG